MNKPSSDITAPYRTSQGQSMLFGHGVVILMMACLAFGIVQFGGRVFPDWHGMYLVGLCLFVSVEAIATRKHLAGLEPTQRIFFHVSEWVAFAVLTKGLIYLVHGPAQVMRDLALWQTDFIGSFFTGEYMLALFSALLVWLVTAAYGGELEDLYNREQDSTWDELGKLQNALHEIRKRIASRVFLMGGLLTTLAVFSRLKADIILLPGQQNGLTYAAPIITVLVYFILALVLLSQTQFALLRTRWLWQRLPLSPNLGQNWLKYGLLSFVILAIIVFFLPTNYSIGLFDTLRIAFEYVMKALSFLLALIMLPFALCLSLFKMTTGPATAPPAQAPAMIPTMPHAQPIAWLEFLRSLAFWVVFLAVIFFALRYYLSQNAALWNAITNFPVFRWMTGVWQGLWRWLKGANQQAAGMVQNAIKRMRQQRAAATPQSVRRMINLGRMNPREKIIYFYVNLVELGGERGIARRPGQTPYQYEDRLSSALPDAKDELHGLTDTFIEARYSQHPVEDPRAQQAGSLWERIKTVLKRWKQDG